LIIAGIVKLKVGDKVSVNMSLDEFKHEQEAAKVPGGWNDQMKQVGGSVSGVLQTKIVKISTCPVLHKVYM